MRNPVAYILVGVPASGKSTWINNQSWAPDCVYISTDTHVENAAASTGKPYNEVFKDVMPDAVREMAQDVVNAREAGKDIIWDQTSTTINSRKKKFNMLPEYKMIAIVFATPEKNEHIRRLASRPDKTIPDHVIKAMIDQFEMPTQEEGFDEVWFV